MSSLASGTHTSASTEAIPPELRELVQELAVAVHKRGIYPATHPMQQGAVEGVLTRLQRVLATRAELSIGVARSHLILDGLTTDPDHPLLSELAARLHDHQVGGVRFVAGVSRTELDAFVASIAESLQRGGEPLGARHADEATRWSHVIVSPLAFEQLALLDEEGNAFASAPRAARAAELWGALAQAALADGALGGSGAVYRPQELARSIEQKIGTPQFDEHLSGFLLQAVGVADSRPAPAEPALRSQVSQLVESLSEPALQQLLQMGGDRARRDAFLQGASESLGAHAVLDLVRVAAEQDGAPISGAVLRLMRKLAREASGHRTGARGADLALRRIARHLLRDWTLDDPNPEQYSRMLVEISADGGQSTVDRRRDVPEPERIIEISLEVQLIAPSTEAALGRLVMRDGAAATLDRLRLLPDSPCRESLVGRLLNESLLREQLQADRPDIALLSHAVDHIRLRAIEPILQAIDSRSDADPAWTVTLLQRLGVESFPLLRELLPACSTRVLRQLAALFDRLDAWPPGADILAVARHPDATVRREVLRFLLRHDATREAALLLALRDSDIRTFHQAMQVALRGCSIEASRLLMRRYDDESLGLELRPRIVRAIASAGSPEALAWLGERTLTNRWWRSGRRLRKGSPEVLAAIGAIAQHYRGEDEAEFVLRLAARSRDEGIRRAAAALPDAVGSP